MDAVDGFDLPDDGDLALDGLLNTCLHGHDGHEAVFAVAEPFYLNGQIVCDVHNVHITSIGCQVGPDVIQGLVYLAQKIRFFLWGHLGLLLGCYLLKEGAWNWHAHFFYKIN
jgi:hypothetical protein